MKRFLLSIGLLFLAVVCFAQLQEVRGITSSISVNRPNDRPGAWLDSRTTFITVIFENNNDFAVSVDADLYRNSTGETSDNTYKPAEIVQSKSFVLEKGGKYVWVTSVGVNYMSQLAGYHSKYKAYKQ